MHTLSTTISTTPAIWIPDVRATHCYKCDVLFSLFKRKHHCRLCSRIHCDSCTTYRDILPSFIQHLCSLKSEDERFGHVRLCLPCFNLSKHSRQNRKFIYIAMALPLLIREVFSLRILCVAWRDSIRTLIGIYRGVQYAIGSRPYTVIEKTFFRVHVREFMDHNQWQRHVYVLHGDVKKNPITTSCQTLLCRKGCSKFLTAHDIIFMYKQRHHVHIKNLILKHWKEMCIEEHIEMIHYWILFTIDAPEYWDGIYEMCQRSLTFSMLIYMRTRRLALFHHIKRGWKKNILTSFKAIQLFKNVANIAKTRTSVKCINQVLAQFSESFLIPWDSEWICNDIALADTKIFNSATCPIRIVMHVEHQQDPTRQQTRHVLIKYDNVINDCVAMSIAYFLNKLERMQIRRYKIMYVDANFGMLEMIKDAVHLHDIKYTLNSSILNFILKHNEYKTINDIRMQLIETVASASLFSYTIGVGDRHMRNMMITEDGEFFHIDFGYMLGQSPRGQNAITLTYGIVDALGGVDSISYQKVVAACKKYYMVTRRHADFFRRLCQLTLDIDEDCIRSHFVERFLPAEFDYRAVQHLELALSSATDSSWTNTMLEFGHALKTSAQDIFHFEF